MNANARACLIISNAHGGSTVTNIAIGQHNSVFSAGTLKGFPDNSQLSPSNSCSCGAEGPTCSFWGRVASNVDLTQSLHDRDSALFSSILRESQCQVVVDVDHGLTRLVELLGNSALDVRVLYANRSLRGVIHSQVRKSVERGEFKRPVIDYIMLCLKVGRAWAIRPRISSRFCDLRGVRHIMIDYETLCREPEVELNLVGKLLDLDYAHVSDRISRERVLKMPSHLIRGNRKLRQNQTISLHLDDSWRSRRQYDARFFGALGAAFGLLEARLLMSQKLRKMGQQVGRIS